MGNLILDLGEDGTPIGIELLDASKNFNVSKIVMKGIEALMPLSTFQKPR